MSPQSTRSGENRKSPLPDIIVTGDGPVRTIRINRPDKKNALTLPMYDAIGYIHIDKTAR